MVHTNQLGHYVEKVFRTAISQFYQKIVSCHLTLSTYTPEIQNTLHIRCALNNNNKYNQAKKVTLVLYDNRKEEDRNLLRKHIDGVGGSGGGGGVSRGNRGLGMRGRGST